MYFLGINLRVYLRVGGFGDCGEEFSWEPSEALVAFSSDSEGKEGSLAAEALETTCAYVRRVEVDDVSDFAGGESEEDISDDEGYKED